MKKNVKLYTFLFGFFPNLHRDRLGLLRGVAMRFAAPKLILLVLTFAKHVVYLTPELHNAWYHFSVATKPTD